MSSSRAPGPGNPKAGPGKLGKRRGVILFGAAAAVAAVVALARRKPAASTAGSTGATVLRTFTGPAGTGAGTSGIESQIQALQDALIREERQLAKLEGKKKRKKKREPRKRKREPRKRRRRPTPTPPPPEHPGKSRFRVPRGQMGIS